jgi:hypothetical protein
LSSAPRSAEIPGCRHPDRRSGRRCAGCGRASRRSAPPAPPPHRWLVGCVAENDPRFLARAERFVRSLRWFGGTLAGARVRVCVVDGVGDVARAALEALGAEVRVVPRFLRENPFANKLQLFLDLDWDATDMVLLCDCDTLVVQDPLPRVRGDVVQAKIADLPTVTHARFEQVFAHFGLALPARSYVTDFRPMPTIPYFNSGVLFLPAAAGRRLVPAWRDVNRTLVEHPALLGAEGLHVNQASLAVAVALVGEPVVALDRAFNFPTHLLDEVPPAGFGDCEPVIVHYHDEVAADGGVREPPYPAAAARIRAFNARLRSVRARARSSTRRHARDVLVTGISRSGTSWLCRLLHQHADCVALNEPPEVVALLEREAEPHGLAAFLAETRARVLRGEPIANKLTGGHVTADTADSDALTLYTPTPATSDFVLAVKNTRAFLSRLDGIRRALPETRIVACVRNPFDTLGSWKRGFPHLRDADVMHVPVGHPEDPWLGAADRAALRAIAATTDVAERRARWWCWFAEMLLRHRDGVVLVGYDELVTQPAETLARAFVGHALGSLSEPLAASRPHRTRALLDAHEIEVTRALCLDVARELGVGDVPDLGTGSAFAPRT